MVWHEDKGKIKLVSYVVNTKSKGKKHIILLNTVPELATMGSTMDDNKNGEFPDSLLPKQRAEP